MADFEAVRRAVRVPQCHGEIFTGGEGGKPGHVHGIVLAHLVVIRGVREAQRQKPLLLEVGFVDAGQALRNHGLAAQKARRHGRMLARTAFAVILFAENHPVDSALLVVTRDVGIGFPRFAGEDVFALADLAAEGVGRAQEHVVGNLVEVSAKGQPFARR